MNKKSSKSTDITLFGKNDIVSHLKSSIFPISEVIIGLTNPLHGHSISDRFFSRHHFFGYVLDGKGDILINNKPFQLKKGLTIIIKKGTILSISQDNDHPLKIIWVLFSSTYINYMLENYRLNSAVYSVNNEYNFQNLAAIIKSEKDYSLMFFVANNIHEIITQTSSINFNSYDSPANLIKNKLDATAYEKIPLSAIADELGISLSTLNRTFKKSFGVSPGKYILENKINIAKSLLSSSSLPIKRISALLNFTDEFYFTYYFTKKMGISPSAFRKQMKE